MVDGGLVGRDVDAGTGAGGLPNGFDHAQSLHPRFAADNGLLVAADDSSEVRDLV
jgi:hypothetical protein